MNIHVLNSLYEAGTLTQMYRAGFIGAKIFLYRDIYLWVDAQVKTRGISKTQAVLEAEIKFERSEQTIWNALRSFE